MGLTTSESNTSASTWRLVHLSKHQGNLGITFKVDNLGFLHFVVKIVSFTGTFTNTSENRVTTVGFGDVVLK
jgi:hypothetical protein